MYPYTAFLFIDRKLLSIYYYPNVLRGAYNLPFTAGSLYLRFADAGSKGQICVIADYFPV